MNTKMSVSITIKPGIDSRGLYDKISQYGANVTDLGEKVFVTAQIDIREDAIEHIIAECRKCGEIDVEAKMVKE